MRVSGRGQGAPPSVVALSLNGGVHHTPQTTLLNHLLKERGTTHIAVIENEFGEVNIDKQLGK
jgi:hypothetical protein